MRSMTLATALAAGLVLTAGAAAALAQDAIRDKSITVVLAVEPDSLDPCDTQTAQNANVVRGQRLRVAHACESGRRNASNRCSPSPGRMSANWSGIQAEGRA